MKTLFNQLIAYFEQIPDNLADWEELAQDDYDKFKKILNDGFQLLLTFKTLIQEQKPCFAYPNRTDLDLLQPGSPEEAHDIGPAIPYFLLNNEAWTTIHHIFFWVKYWIPIIQQIQDVVLKDNKHYIPDTYPSVKQLEEAYGLWWEKFIPFKISNCPMDLGDSHVQAKIEIFFNDPNLNQMFYLTWHIGVLVNGDSPSEIQPTPPDKIDWQQVSNFILDLQLPIVFSEATTDK